MPHSVVLVEDETIVLQGIRTLVEEQTSLEVVGEAGCGRKALELCDELEPDVVVMDIRMGGLNGIEATREITGSEEGPGIVILSVVEDRRTVRRAFEAGADAYVPKNSAFEELNRAIDAVLRGEGYLSPVLVKPVVNDWVRHAQKNLSEEGAALTPRERQVLRMVADGYTSREIAGELRLSERTVNNHRTNLMNKLNLHSISALTKYAVQQGFTSLRPKGDTE